MEMIRRWRRLIAGGFLLLAVVVLYFCLPRIQPPVILDLPDGTSLELVGVSQGKVLHFHEGKPWQKVLYSLCGTNIPPRFRGSDSSMPSQDANGNLALRLRRNNIRQFPEMHVGVVQIVRGGSEIPGSCIVLGSGRAPFITNKDYYWMFPTSTNHDMRFRVYFHDYVKHKTTTNEFTLRNPAFR